MKEKVSSSSKVGAVILLLEEKLCREYDLSLEELRQATVKGKK